MCTNFWHSPTDATEHSLDNGDGPPCLLVKPCTPEFYQAHYQLVSLHNFKKRGGD